jgi:hypothetical protein
MTQILTLVSPSFSEIWQRSSNATQMLVALHDEAWSPRAHERSKYGFGGFSKVPSALESFFQWYFERIEDSDKLENFQTQLKNVKEGCRLRLESRQITLAEANLTILQHLCWHVWEESEYGELCTVPAKILRKFVKIRSLTLI